MKYYIAIIMLMTSVSSNASILGSLGKFGKKLLPSKAITSTLSSNANSSEAIARSFSNINEQDIFIKICNGMINKGSWIKVESLSESTGLSMNQVKSTIFNNKDLLKFSVNTEGKSLIKLRRSGLATFRKLNHDPVVQDKIISIFNAMDNKNIWVKASSITERLDLQATDIKIFAIRNPDLLELKISASGDSIVRVTAEGRRMIYNSYL